MQIVIDITENEWEYLNKLCDNSDILGHYERLIVNGTPLPKGHGRLIDADDIDNHVMGHVDTRSCPTIIEADKENKHEE